MAFSRAILLSTLALLACIPASGASFRERLSWVHARRPVAMQVRAGGNMSVDFLSSAGSPPIQGAAGFGVLNLGTVSYAGVASVPGVRIRRAAGAFDVETGLVLRIGNQDPFGGTAMVRAWLETPVAPYRIYLDGVRLTQQPVCVKSRARVGVATQHRLRIRVPSNTSESQSTLQTEISLQVVSN